MNDKSGLLKKCDLLLETRRRLQIGFIQPKNDSLFGTIINVYIRSKLAHPVDTCVFHIALRFGSTYVYFLRHCKYTSIRKLHA